MADGPPGSSDEAGLLSVAAHGMLQSLGIAKATIATLRLHWGDLDEATSRRLLERAEEHLAFLGESLIDLVRGTPAEVREALDALDQRERPDPRD
jgi:hypothetical protein